MKNFGTRHSAAISSARGDNLVVIVSEDQQSLAIGKGGQNVRLAAKLTGWKIDIQSATNKPDISKDISPEDEEEPEESVV